MRIELDGEVFNLIGRGPVHTGRLRCTGSIPREDLSKLIGTELDGRIIRAIESFCTVRLFDGSSVGVLFEPLCQKCGDKGWIVEGQTIDWSYGEQVECGSCTP